MNLLIPRTKSILSIVTFCLALTPSAFSTTITVGGLPVANAGETTSITEAAVDTFDSGLPSNYTLTGSAGIVSGSVGGLYASPLNDSTPYLSTGVGSVHISFASAPIEYFGLYWGSIDPYNSIAFTNTLGQTTEYSGNDLAAAGVTANGAESAYVNFFATPGENWTSVTLSSTENAFEFDNVASVAPEPASFVSFGLGLALAAFGIVRRSKS